MSDTQEQTQLSLMVPVELKKDLKVYCALTGKKQKPVVEDALREYMKNHPA